MSKVERQYWRIIAGHPKTKEDKVAPKSIILGDWLRWDYVSVGFDDPKQVSRKRFNDMHIGDKIVAVTDKHIWAVGEITGEVYSKDEEELYSHRRNVVWYRVTRLGYDAFSDSLRNKLMNPHAVMPLDKNDWETILACIN